MPRKLTAINQLRNRKHDPIIKKIIRYKNMYLFLLPALLSAIFFSYKPMVGIVMAFQDFDIAKGYMRSPFVGFENFQRFLSNPDFYMALRNTLCLSLLSFVFVFPAPILFALILNEIKWSRFKKVTQTVSYLPHFISWIVAATLIQKLLLDQDMGLVNDIIAAFGGSRIGFMREPMWFWPIVIMGGIWKETGWNSIIYLAALTSIDAELYEAAKVDGAGRFQRLLHVTLPGIAPTIGLLLVLNVGSLINAGANFDAVYNLQNPLVSSTAYILEMYAYYEGITFARYSYATAITLMQSVVTLLMVLGANKIYKKLNNGYSAF